MASQQATIDRLREERNSAQARADTAEQLLGELEAGLTDTNHAPSSSSSTSSAAGALDDAVYSRTTADNTVAQGPNEGWRPSYPSSSAHTNSDTPYGGGGKYSDSNQFVYSRNHSSDSGGAYGIRRDLLHAVPEQVPLPPPSRPRSSRVQHSPLPPSPPRRRERNAAMSQPMLKESPQRNQEVCSAVPLSPRRLQAKDSPSIW
jgi:hypothetical protein